MWKKVLIFALGAGVGSLVTWKIVETKYQQIADEEIESVKEYFKQKLEAKERIVDVKTFKDKIEKPSITVYADGEEEISPSKDLAYSLQEKIDELGYDNMEEDVQDLDQDTPVREYIKPYVISPEEFGEFGNTMKSMTLYSDGTLVDEDEQIIGDPESVIGDGLEHFGDFEDDAVHIRDENIECDYEIIKDERTFSEVYKEEN